MPGARNFTVTSPATSEPGTGSWTVMAAVHSLPASDFPGLKSGYSSERATSARPADSPHKSATMQKPLIRKDACI